MTLELTFSTSHVRPPWFLCFVMISLTTGCPQSNCEDCVEGADGSEATGATSDSMTTEDASTTEPSTGDGDGDPPPGDGDGDPPPGDGDGDGDGDPPPGDGDGDPPPECEPEQALCDGVCVSLFDNSDHCGMCGNVCGEGSECFGEACLYVERTVFVTSEAYSGNLGGISGANDTCQNHADSAGLLGTYWAWLGTNDASPADDFSKQGYFVLADQTLVAESWADLTDGELLSKIDLTEYGEAHDFVAGECGVPVWTSVNQTGGAMLGNCEDWTNGGELTIGRTGSLTHLDTRWTRHDNCSYLCSVPSPIYCFQQ